jgi:hypothetical protein
MRSSRSGQGNVPAVVRDGRGRGIRAAWRSLVILCGTMSVSAPLLATGKTFSVKDAIEMTEFAYPAIGLDGKVSFSPNRRYFMILTERGDTEKDVAEYTIWVWRSDDG